MFNWKLRDIIMVCIFSIIFGLVYLGAVYISNFLSLILTPFGLGPFGYEIIYGIWFMASTFIPCIIRKPGVALISELLSALLEVLMGSMFGPSVILPGIVQGLGAEAVFFKTKYKKFDMLTLSFAALGACIMSFLLSLLTGGIYKLPFSFLLGMFIVRSLSSILFSGVISSKIFQKLKETGALNDR